MRQAFHHAININAIKRVVMRNAATPTGLMIAPGINGFQKDMNNRVSYDPDAAKKLLADAGYPNGFPVTFDCPNDRYVNDEEICTAVIPKLERYGIKVTPNLQTKTKKFNNQEGAARFFTYEILTGSDAGKIWRMRAASAENIPASDNSFERASMSFGLRNITNRNKSCLLYTSPSPRD